MSRRDPRPLPALSAADVERFWAKVDRSGGPGACWPWTACCDPKGYGRFGLAGIPEVASRVAWILTYGDPGPLSVCHRCDNPPCCNPAHLFTGTDLDNNRDMWTKGRGRITHHLGDKNGSARLNDQAVLVIRFVRAKGVPAKLIRQLYGISDAHLYEITTGASWPHVGGPRISTQSKRISAEQREAIVSRLARGEQQKAIALDYGLAFTTISKIAKKANVGRRSCV